MTNEVKLLGTMMIEHEGAPLRGIRSRKTLALLASTQPDISPRHRSWRALFSATWQQLQDDEQILLSKLSVFRGDFTREAAETVAGARLAQLQKLTDMALLRYNAARRRYSNHELLRQYCVKQRSAKQHYKDAKEAFEALGAEQVAGIAGFQLGRLVHSQV